MSYKSGFFDAQDLGEGNFDRVYNSADLAGSRLWVDKWLLHYGDLPRNSNHTHSSWISS